MTARDWIEVVLAVLVVLTLVILGLSVAFGLRQVRRVAVRVEETLARVEREASESLAETRAALQKTTELAESLNVLVRSQVTPTVEVARAALSHVETTLKGAADATATIRRIAAGAEALTAPSALKAAVERTTGSSMGRLALLAAGIFAMLQGTLRSWRRASNRSTQEAEHGNT